MKTTGAEIGTTHACSAPKSEDHARPPAVFADDGSLSYREAYLQAEPPVRAKFCSGRGQKLDPAHHSVSQIYASSIFYSWPDVFERVFPSAHRAHFEAWTSFIRSPFGESWAPGPRPLCSCSWSSHAKVKVRYSSRLVLISALPICTAAFEHVRPKAQLVLLLQLLLWSSPESTRLSCVVGAPSAPRRQVGSQTSFFPSRL